MLLEFQHSVTLLCSIAGVSRSAYYKYKTKKHCKSTEVDDIIENVYNKSNKRAGYRMVKMMIKNQYGITVNHKKVQRIMQEKGLFSIVRPKRKKAVEAREIKNNLLNRDFHASKPNQKYATDITYIPIASGMMYLSTIIDLYDNYPVAWKISDSVDKQITIDTIKQLAHKVNLHNAVIHSDQGIQYTNKDYVALLKSLNVKQSMSRKGNCWDNACAESFFSNYKCECVYLAKSRLKSKADVMEITEDYLDYYINIRPQKRLGGLPPKAFRERNENG